MLRLCDNPPTLSPQHASLAELPGRWWVGHTKSRFEKAFAWDLLPLFPSYVFVCGDDEDRYTAMTTNRLCTTIEVPDQEKLVAELVAIERALSAKAALDLYAFAVAGQRCRITAGPFEGLEGVVVRRNGTARIVLYVGILAQGASMEIDADLLEPVN